MKRYLVLAFGVAAVAFAAIFIRLAEAPPLVIAAWRLALAAIIVAPIALIKSRDELKRLTRREILLSIASGAFLAVHFGLWIASLSYTTVATSVVLVTITPIFVAVASYLLFKEKITKRIIVGIGVSIVGAGVIGYANWQVGTRSVTGSLLSLGGALAVTGYLLIGRKLRQHMGLLTYIFLTYSSASVFLLAAAFISGAAFTGYPSMTYLWLVLLAVVPQLLGHSSLNWSLRYVPATLVTIAVLGEPVGATILATVILHELPSAMEIIGGVLILVGIVMAFSRQTSPATKT